jgi:Fe-S-cluster containining protein
MNELKALLQKDDPFLRPSRLGSHNFPGIWTAMMPRELFGLRIPEERRATCMNCPKAAYEGFRPDYRCCTYHPRVANFLLGLALETPVGERVLDNIMDRGMLIPEGMHYAPAQWVDYLDDLQNDAFGRSEKVLCPNLDQSTGYCNIHAFRNAVCSTFFCYKDHGDAGDGFWDQLQVLGSQVEMALGQWALAQVGFDLDRYFRAFDQLGKKIQKASGRLGWQDEARELLWGDWLGREKELMRACAAVVVRERENLWEIANSQPIRESARFDKAMVKAVPKRLEEQIDPEDLEESGGETVRPSTIWQDVMKAYWKLWDLPEGAFALSGKVRIEGNPRQTSQDQFYQDKPYMILYYPRKGSKVLDWKLGITDAEKAVLDLFAGKSRELDATLLMEPAIKALSNGKGFLAEMLRRKVLVA